MHVQLQANIKDTTKLFKTQNLKSCCICLRSYSCCMYALPGIVDGARKILQGGSGLWVVASSPILEATISRKQCMNAVTSTVRYLMCIMVREQVNSAVRKMLFCMRQNFDKYLHGPIREVAVTCREICCCLCPRHFCYIGNQLFSLCNLDTVDYMNILYSN